SSASRPPRTLSCRVSPPATTGRCGRPANTASIAGASPTGCSRSTLAANPSAAGRSTGLPPSVRNCFRAPTPNPPPEPAATRIAAIRIHYRCRPAAPASTEGAILARSCMTVHSERKYIGDGRTLTAADDDGTEQTITFRAAEVLAAQIEASAHLLLI